MSALITTITALLVKHKSFEFIYPTLGTKFCTDHCCYCYLVTKMCMTLCNPMDCIPPGSSGRGIAEVKYWSGLPCFLQGIFLTQGLNSCLLHLLHWQADSLLLSHQGNPTGYCGKLVRDMIHLFFFFHLFLLVGG